MNRILVLIFLCLCVTDFAYSEIAGTEDTTFTDAAFTETASDFLSGKGAQLGIPAVAFRATEDGGTYTVTLQILAVMTALTLLPSIVMMMTAFTRIIIVFAILRQALGLQQTPSNQILIGLALFLSIFIMQPVLREANEIGLQPYLAEEISPLEAVKAASDPNQRR